MRFGLSSVCPRSFGSPFIGPHRRFSFFSFMSFCLHVSSSSSFLSLARTIVWTLVCTHTRTRTLLTTRFRWPRFVTMRFGSLVVPLHLVLLHRQPHTPLSVSFFSFSSVPFACTCALPPFRAGWRPHMPPFGEACVYPLESKGTFRFGTGGVTVDFLVTPMKLWKSTGWKFGRKLPYLFHYLGNRRKWYSTHLCVGAFPSDYSIGL